MAGTGLRSAIARSTSTPDRFSTPAGSKAMFEVGSSFFSTCPASSPDVTTAPSAELRP